MVIKLTCLFIYLATLVLIYFLISKRLKFLNRKHIQYTGSTYLGKMYTKLMLLIGISLISLFVITTFIVLTIF